MNAAADLHSIGDLADVESTVEANVDDAGQHVTRHSIADDGQIVTGRVSAFVPAGLSGLIGRKGFTINGGGDVRTRDILVISRSLIFNSALWDIEMGIAQQFAPPAPSQLVLLQ